MPKKNVKTHATVPINWFLPYSDSWHVIINFEVMYTIHDMVMHVVAVLDIDVHDMSMHGVTVHEMGVHDMDVNDVGIHKKAKFFLW
jgi:hypothetical protein